MIIHSLCQLSCLSFHLRLYLSQRVLVSPRVLVTSFLTVATIVSSEELIIDPLLSAFSSKALLFIQQFNLLAIMVIVNRVLVKMPLSSSYQRLFKAKYCREEHPLLFGTEDHQVSDPGTPPYPLLSCSLFGRHFSSLSAVFQELCVCFQTHSNLGRGFSSQQGHTTTSHKEYQRDISLASLV